MNTVNLFRRLGKIAYTLSAAFMIVSLVVGALPAQTVLAVPGGGGSDCAHENTDGDADLCQDGTGQSGSWTAPDGYEIYDFVIKAGTQDFHGSVPGCYNLVLTSTSVSWERVGDGPDCKEISHVEIYYRPVPPPVDVCPNLDGDQAEVPAGYELVDGICEPIVIDVCPNLEENQAEVPAGYELVNGNCEPVSVEVPLCHATSSEQNPYNLITVSVSSVDWWNQHGHGGHGDDIWASFSVGGVVIPAQGDQGILANGCEPIPPEMILICYNNQTMEIPLQALSNYPDALLGSCPASAVPAASLECFSLQSSTFHVTISNTGPDGEIGYYTDLDPTIVSLGSLTTGASAAVQIPGNATTLYLVAKLQTGWTDPVAVALDKTELRACEEDPVSLSPFCSYVDPLYPNGWRVSSLNPFAIEFTWAYGPASSAAPIPLAAQPASVTFTTAEYPAELMRVYSQGILLASSASAAPCPALIPLTLTAICATDPANFNGWRVSNPNAGEVGFEYNSAGGSGVGSVPANSSVDITTPILVPGDILALYSGGVLQASAAAATGCIPGEPPPDNPPGNPPVSIPETSGNGTVLIPVTGLDTGAASGALPGAFFNLSLGFLGLGLVLSGLGRKREA